MKCLFTYFLIFITLLINNIIIYASTGSFIFIDKFNREVIMQYFPMRKLFGSLGSCAIVKLNFEVEYSEADEFFPTIYITDPSWGRFLYNIGPIYIGAHGKKGKEIDNFYEPHGICADTEGNIFVADSGNRKVVKLKNKKGKIEYLWSINDNLYEPYAIALDKEKNIYVLDRIKCCIKKYNSDGNPINSFNGSNKFGKFGTGQKEFWLPTDIAVDNDLNIYITDAGNGKIKKFSKTGKFICEVDKNLLKIENAHFTGIDFDKFGCIYVVEYNNNLLLKFNSNLNFITSLGNNGTNDYILDKPIDVAIYKKYGIIFVLEAEGGKFYRMTPGLKIVWSTNKIFSPFDIQKRKVELKYILTSESLVDAFVKDTQGNLVRKLVTHKWSEINIEGYKIVWNGDKKILTFEIYVL